MAPRNGAASTKVDTPADVGAPKRGGRCLAEDGAPKTGRQKTHSETGRQVFGAARRGGRPSAEVDAPKRGGGRRLGARPPREGGLRVARDGLFRKRSDFLRKSRSGDLFGPKKPGPFCRPAPPRRGMGKRLTVFIRGRAGAGLPDGAAGAHLGRRGGSGAAYAEPRLTPQNGAATFWGSEAGRQTLG